MNLPGIEALDIEEEVWVNALHLAVDQLVNHPNLLEVQRRSVEHGRWDIVYLLSYYAGLETSVLIDADDRIFIDWGLPGSVHLRQPVGAKIPFKLWVHTHPRMSTYWSGTDKNSLAISTMILEHAAVLGMQGIKYSQNSTLSPLQIEEHHFIGSQDALQNWTDQDIESWSHWYDERGLTFETEESLTNICWLSTFNQRR